MLRLVCTLITCVASFVAGLPKEVVHDPCASLQAGADHVVRSHVVVIGGTANISNVAAQNLTTSNAFTFCRVVGRMPYGPNNTLNFEVWLPEAESYNDRYLSVGAYLVVLGP